MVISLETVIFVLLTDYLYSFSVFNIHANFFIPDGVSHLKCVICVYIFWYVNDELCFFFFLV
jgi:hypothetical protein